MARLYSDLLDGAGRRYYFNLESAPGGIAALGPAALRITGLAPTIQDLTEVFRNPATAALSLEGRLPVLAVIMAPAQAPLSYQGRTPTLLAQTVITNAMPPDYSNPQENPPTIVYIATQTPDRAVLTINSLEHNITQGGNIGFLSPGVGAVSLQGRAPNFPREAQVGALTVAGLIPSLHMTLVIEPEAGVIAFNSLNASLAVPFIWVDEDPPPTATWIDDS